MEDNLVTALDDIKLGTRQVEEATGISRYRLHVLAQENLIPFTRISDKTQSNILIAVKDLPAVVEANEKRYARVSKSPNNHHFSEMERQFNELSNRVDALAELIEESLDRATTPASTSTP